MSTVTSDSRRVEAPQGGTTADLAFTDLADPKGLAGIDGGRPETDLRSLDDGGAARAAEAVTLC